MSLHSYDPVTQETKYFDAGDLVGGVAPYDGKLLVARRDGVFKFDPQTEAYSFIAPIEPDKPWNRPNDINVVECSDGKTRVFIGTMPINPSVKQGTGALYVLDPNNGEMVKLRDKLTTTNGIAGFTTGGQTKLFFSDSHPSCQTVYQAEFDPTSNTLAHESTFKNMESMKGRPDGATMVSVNGTPAYAISAIDSGKIIFYDAQNKTELQTISLPEGVTNNTKLALSDNGHILVTTLDRNAKDKTEHKINGRVYVAKLPENIKPLNASISADKIVTDGNVASYRIGDQPIKPFTDMVHTRQRLLLPESSAPYPPNASEIAYDNTFTGLYPPHFKDIYKGKKVGLIGYGQVVERMIAPAADFLGLNIEYYDPAGKPARQGSHDVAVDSPDKFSEDAMIMVLSPPAAHLEDVKRAAQNGKPFYVEKPVVVGEQSKAAEQLLANLKAPAYCGDFHYFMAMPLMSLMGAKMPYRDTLTISKDTKDGTLAHAITTREPLFDLKDVKKVTAKYLQGGEAASLKGRDLGNGKAGGMVYDLVVHQTNILNAVGLEVNQIDDVQLSTNTDKAGVYRPINVQDLRQDRVSEMHAHITGNIGNYGATFEFEVGKYAAADEQYIQIELKDGTSVKFEYTPPNRKTFVSLLDKDGKELGKVESKADPYLLMLGHAVDHLSSGRRGAMFGHEGLLSVKQIESIHDKARNPDPQLRSAEIGKGHTLSARKTI